MTTTIDHRADRVDGGDWDRITEELNEYGGALLPRLLTPEEAARIAGLYEQDGTSAPRSTWAGTASGRASTATSPAPTPNRSSS